MTRRHISLLPNCNQTADLSAFFGATVDQVFQPGATDAISGYIGHTIPGMATTTDFYLGEPSKSRTFYQFEPGMVSYTALNSNQINYSLTYPDLVAYLAVSGANITDHQRLFENEYYSWAPPINLDMLVNYRDYYWFGNVIAGSKSPYIWNQIDKNDAVTLSSNSLAAVATNTDGSISAVRSTGLPNGSWYVEFSIISGSNTTIQQCGLANGVDAINPGSPGEQLNRNAIIYQTDGQIFNDSLTTIKPLSIFGPGDVIGMAWSSVSKKLWFRCNDSKWDNDTSANPSNNSGGFDITTILSNGPVCLLWGATGVDCQVIANFGGDAFIFAPPIGFVGPVSKLASVELPILTLRVPISLYHGNGTTTIFALPESIRAVPLAAEIPTVYVNDLPVAATYSGGNLQLAVAPPSGSTVMLCRTADLAAAISGMNHVDVSDLNTQGVMILSSGMRIKIIDASHLSDAWDSRTWDSSLWDASNDAIYIVDGIGSTLRLTPYSLISRNIGAQYITIDRSSRDQNQWSLHNSWVHGDSFAWSGQVFPQRQARRPIIEFVRDIVLYPTQIWVDQNLQSQQIVDPLFMLYDLYDHALDDPSFYQNSSFTGNRLFGYAAGNGPIDTILSRTLRYDDNGYIIFNNDVATVQYNYLLGTIDPMNTAISGLTNYAINDGMTIQYISFWQPSAQTTSQVLTTGFYPIPDNLQANPDYLEVGLISRSTWSDHFNSIINNQTGAVSSATGSNYRDTARDLTLGTAILQHHAPLLKTMLLAASSAFDVPRAIRYVELEYTRFRNKFARKLVEFRNRGILQDNDLAGLWVSQVLVSLKVGHTDGFPFALSTMAGGQYFIPPTPTGLAIMPAVVPTFITDTTHNPAVTMLRGHDGSLTPTFGDWRDAVMLALEMQIFRSLSIFKQLSSNLSDADFITAAAPLIETRPTFDIQRWIGSRYYIAEKGYSRAEVTAVLAPMFELWAQINRLDYHSNTTYDANDPFTWNFRDVLDVGGQPLPGHWRAIYNWYFDTDSPHLRPWAMLGFVSQPDWWISVYGAAPYTRLNTALWNDVTAGRILHGSRAGIDLRYARPNLLTHLPIDNTGNLLNPVRAGIVTSTVIFELGSRPWQAGDQGPAETLWQNSPSARFALARASFLLKPARFVEQCWDTDRIGYVNGQWVDQNSYMRPRNVTQYVHGEINPNLVPWGTLPLPPTVTTVLGLSQWLADYLLSTGQDSTALGTAVRNLQVALIHPMAGFVSNVKLVADNFGLLPAEDVHITMYQSPAISSEVYSGVIIEWTGRSWRVIGFDGQAPFFTVIPPNTTGPKGLISLATAAEPSIVPWRPGSYYPVQILVDNQNSVYQCLRGHTSGSNFETIFWTARPDLATAMIRAPRVITYNNGEATTRHVPYGTEYTSYQDVADFLLGWERWLVSRGWRFTNVDPQNQILNWSLSVREFLSWAQVQWPAGNFIAVSPGQRQLNFLTQQGTILNVEDNVTGFYGLIDRSGQPISQRDAIVSRFDGAITLAARHADIFLSRLEICNIEHVLVTNNVTIFSDNVYLPLFNARQQRLRLDCARASQWNGRLEAPGYIINGAALTSNFEKAVDDIRLMFDIELADSIVLRNYARHLIGMQKREYMDNLLVSDIEQFELYQGMIQEKGTPGVFNKLVRSHRVSDNSTLHFLEEWAFRIADFGAPRDPLMTFQLRQTDVRDYPQFISLQPQAGAALDWIVFQSDDSRWYDKPLLPFFPSRVDYAPASLPTAGPVRTSDVSSVAFHLSDVPNLYNSNNILPARSRIWVYDSIALFDAINWYVDAQRGDDLNSGTSVATPFKTLQKVSNCINHGDIVNVASGIYTASDGTNVLEISQRGTASSPIIFQAMPGATPVIIGSQSSATIHFNNVAYITLRGFTVIGWNDTLVLSDAQTNLGPIYDGSGIIVDHSHHIILQDCIIHDFPNNGVLINQSDYITVQHCIVYNNAWYSSLNGSGINILNSQGIDGTTIYKTFIQQNICYNNSNKITHRTTSNIIGGNGISITNNHNDLIGYNGRTLLENNLCYNNGGDGILVINSAHVDVIFNTAYLNQTNTNQPLGEIVAFNANDCNIFNNIMYAKSSPLATSLNNLDVEYCNNMGFALIPTNPIPGVNSFTDPLFYNPPTDFTIRPGSFAIHAANSQFVTNVDLANNRRTKETGYDLGCFQSGAAPATVNGRHPFDVLCSFETGVNQANAVLSITTPTEDVALSTTRIKLQTAMTLGNDDIGNYLLIDGLVGTVPDLQGLHFITAVNVVDNTVDILDQASRGIDFTATQTSAPNVRILRSIRFATVDAINSNYGFEKNDLIWIDHYLTEQWAVLQWDGSEWVIARQQPQRIDPLTIGETVIYKAGAQIVGSQMILNQPVVDDVVVIDPLAGLICNISDREIDYRTDYDPARYNAGFGIFNINLWGPDEVGHVWWNLATVRFLDTFTDVLGESSERDLAELQYRTNFWSQIAATTSVEVYEWVESSVNPLDFSTTGTVLNADAPSWVERSVYDPVLQRDTTLYYFWVKNLTTIPNREFRHTSISQVTAGIANPSALNIAWMSAISPVGLLVNGVTQYLDNTSTVMKIRLVMQSENVGHHDQWLLMRPNDATSLPPDFFWQKMRDGLVGFTVDDATISLLPNAKLSPLRKTGIGDGQSMFQVDELTIPAWQAAHIYYFGDLINNGGSAFQCVVSGISLGNGPLGFAGQIIDGTVLWKYSETTISHSSWQASYSYRIGDTISNYNKGYICIGGGSSSPPATGPSGYSHAIFDGTVLWAYHGSDTSRRGLLNARKTFIKSVNNVLAQNALNVTHAALIATIKIPPAPASIFKELSGVTLAQLTWAQIDASYPYEPPPSNEWDAGFEVHTLAQRNNLLARVEFLTAITSYQTIVAQYTANKLPLSSIPRANIPYISILLNGFASSIQQWSIWVFDPAAALRVIENHPNLEIPCALIANADLVFSIKTAYERTVQTTSQRDALIGVRHLDRVLVTQDTLGFWAIYQWLQPDLKSVGRFQLWRAQNYDVTPFIIDSDWYDLITMAQHGYRITDPPNITYPDEASRNAIEGTAPTNRFVKIINNKTDFLWTAYINGAWQTIAIGNGTIQLSSWFNESTRIVYGLAAEPSFSNVIMRDGSWELRILAHKLRYSGLISESDINRIWFDMINFIHVQQNEVDWVFKTSFMALSGTAVPITQSPILLADQSHNLIDYINEVKPYRVKVRESTTQYTPAIDGTTVTSSDFDNSLYLDPLTKRPRPLDPTNVNDIVILQTAPWKDWYANYASPNSPVRSLTITILFDRLGKTGGNWDMVNWDSDIWDFDEGFAGAAYRILTANPQADLASLMGLGEKENTINGTLLSTFNLIDDGGTLVPESYAVDINPGQPSQPGGYDLRAPYFGAQHPEERVPFGADDGLQITVTADPLAGGPPQSIKLFEVGRLTGTTATLFYDMISQSAASVLVFCDGVRTSLGTDYTVDYLRRSVTVNLTVNATAVQRVIIQVLSFGAISAITEQHFLSYGTNPLTLNAPTLASNVVAVVNGTPLAASGLTVSGATVALTSPPSPGSDVALAVLAGGATTATQIHVQTLTYTGTQTWTLAFPDLVTQPAHAGTIVEINGLRLTPPTTYYGSFTVAQPWMYLPLMPDFTTTVTVYVDGIVYTEVIPICTTTDPSSPYPFHMMLPTVPSTLVAGQFILYNNLLIALDPTFISSNVVIVMIFPGAPADYMVTGNVLTIHPVLANNSLIVATTFSNAGSMGMQTVTYTVGAATRQIVPQPFAPDYAHVTMNGLKLAPDDDYSIQNVAFQTTGAYFTAPVLTVFNPTAGSIVATMFTNAPARESMMWMFTTRTPAFIRMMPAMIDPHADDVPIGWDASALDTQGFDDAQLHAVPTYGSNIMAPQFSIKDRFESIRLSPYMAGTLVADLGTTDSSFSIQLFVQAIAPKMQETNPLPTPDDSRNRPGAIWIENERIEYFGYARSGNIVTVSGLRRASRGTSMGSKRLVLSATGDGTQHSYTFNNVSGVVDVTIDGIMQAPSTFVVSGNTTVTLTVDTDSYAVIGLSISATHLAGATVWNGKQIFLEDVPIGPSVGNRELEPMQRIISG